MGMKKESKKSREAKENEEGEAAPLPDDVASDRDEEERKKKKKAKKEKKRSRQEVDCRGNDNDDDDAAGGATDEDKEQRTAARLAKKSAKKELKSQLLSKVPTHDSDGIPHSKIQIRRMMRRVKHGMDPIATEEEEREIREREKRGRAEEEALYAEGHDEAVDADDAEEEVEDGDDGEKQEESGRVENNEENVADEGTAEKEEQKTTFHNPPSKRTKRAKPVPPDYVCMACKNGLPDFTPHWIYDCPSKKTQRGCNKVAKRLRGLRDPPSRKVFVSGLPFDCNDGDVKRFFEESMGMGMGGAGGEEDGKGAELVHCKLHKFEDSKRCKGHAILTFDTDELANSAMKLSGSIWKTVEEPGTKSKKKKGKGAVAADEGKKELRLKVSRVLNRHVTKQKKGSL